MTPYPKVVLRYYPEGEDPTEVISSAAVEVNDGDVDLIVHPYTMGARTFSMPPSEAWKLARELARAATAAEDQSA